MKTGNADKDAERQSPGRKILLGLLVIAFLPVILAAALLYFSWGLFLSIAIWTLWGLRGNRILFVYSNSPIWSEYIGQEILPHIQGRAVILNWSERKTWKPSLAVWAFHYFGGRRNFNPMAIVFSPFRLHGTFRFYDAFQDYKRGRFEKLDKLKFEFLDAVK
jgi:hypothetical protein